MNYVEVKFCGQYPLRVMEPRAQLHDFTKWEAGWLSKFLPTILEETIVYEVGAEQGEFGALAAKQGGRLHVFEPSRKMWPNIMKLWDVNGLGHPAGCYAGFVSDVTKGPPPAPGWPEECGAPLHVESVFAHHTQHPDIKRVRLDDYAAATGEWPNVVMVDVEGSELHVLKGAMECFNRGARFYVSVHPDQSFRDHGDSLDKFWGYLGDHDISAEKLSFDHEEHYLLKK